MSVSFVELTMVRGDTPSWQFTCFNSAGTALDLTGATIAFSAKRSQADTVALISHGTGDGYVVVGTPATGGICTLTLAAADTAGLTESVATRLYYGLRITLASGKIVTPVLGTLRVYPDLN